MDFDSFWILVASHGSVAQLHKEEAMQVWNNYSPEQQQAIYISIEKKLQSGGFVHYNPANAIRDNVPRAPRTQVLSYDEYYQRFGTTQPLQGWRMVRLEDQQKTIYVKQCTS